MVTVAPSFSKNSRRLGLPAAALLLAGCASSAPPLPPDTTGVTSTHHIALGDFAPADAALTCNQINDERHKITASMAAANKSIESNRSGNQTAAYIGAVVTPLAYLATEGNYADKDAVKELYSRQDTLIKLGALKACPAP